MNDGTTGLAFAICDETNRGFSTVRTIVGQIDGTDRTTQKRRERLGLERYRAAEAAASNRQHAAGAGSSRGRARPGAGARGARARQVQGLTPSAIR